MLRLAICCGGGFSSSALAAHMEQEIKQQQLEDKISFVFIPVHALTERQDEVDIAMVCPHSEYYVRQNSAKGVYRIPVTIIPPKLYGLMKADAFIEDAQDLLELWKQGGKNMMTCPEEPRPLAVKRGVSHRKWLEMKNNG